MILFELENVPRILQLSRSEGYPDQAVGKFNQQIFRSYIYEGVLTLVYSFVKNIQSTYFVNIKASNQSFLEQYKLHIKEVFNKLQQSSDILSQILG